MGKRGKAPSPAKGITPSERIAGDLELVNSLTSMAALLSSGGVMPSSPLSDLTPLQFNLRNYLITNNRQLLSQLYVEHGIVQTMIDQPVDDAFRSGIEITTSELDKDDFEKLYNYMDRHHVLEHVMQAIKWTRLFGGGAVLIITDQDPKTPLNRDAIKEGTPLEFKAADNWELSGNLTINTDPTSDQLKSQNSASSKFFTYYSKQVHQSRVLPMIGKQPPSIIRQRLYGWGMSEVERLVRSLNQYQKNQDVIYELLDEAKVDIYKIKGMNSSLLTPVGTAGVASRIQNANLIKNHQNALTMDKEDEYEQKQIAFAGLSDILIQIRQGIAGDVKMPVTKLFGTSAAGFSSGEDDIENYNSMIEGQVRSKCKYILLDVIGLCCQHLFGIMPEDLSITFKPLRELSADQQEDVKTKKFERVLKGYTSGLVDPKSAKAAINKDALLPVELDETDDVFMQQQEDEDFGDTEEDLD